MSREIRVSASRLKTLWNCSVLFFYESILGLPSKTHHRTVQGLCIHSIFECLLAPKRVAAFRAILRDGFILAHHPSIERFIRAYDRHHGMSPYEMSDMSDMLRVAFLAIKPYFDPYFTALDAGEPAPFTYHTEKRFKMVVGKAVLSGVIDLLLVYPDKAVCLDLKSQREKFKKAELPHNVQAIVYQLAIYEEYKLLAPVEFILLRHPPSKRYPVMHIQRVEAPPQVALRGLRDYIEHSYGVVNSFGLEEAYSRPCTDKGFCERVCQFYKPFTYLALVKKGGENGDPIKTYLPGTEPKGKQLAADEVLVERRHEGCVIRWKG